MWDSSGLGGGRIKVAASTQKIRKVGAWGTPRSRRRRMEELRTSQEPAEIERMMIAERETAGHHPRLSRPRG